MKRLSRPSSLPPDQLISAKPPALNSVPILKIPVLVGPDETSLPVPSIVSSPYTGPPGWALGAAHRVLPNEITIPALASPPLVMPTRPKHPSQKMPAYDPVVSRTDIPRKVRGI